MHDGATHSQESRRDKDFDGSESRGEIQGDPMTPKELWKHIEVKRVGGKCSPEQSKRAEYGMITVCDSVESIIKSVLEVVK